MRTLWEAIQDTDKNIIDISKNEVNFKPIKVKDTMYSHYYRVNVGAMDWLKYAEVSDYLDAIQDPLKILKKHRVKYDVHWVHIDCSDGGILFHLSRDVGPAGPFFNVHFAWSSNRDNLENFTKGYAALDAQAKAFKSTGYSTWGTFLAKEKIPDGVAGVVEYIRKYSSKIIDTK